MAEAKSGLSRWVREVESGEPIMITRHGKPAAAIVRAADLEQLRRLQAAGPEAGLASVLGGWDDSEKLADTVDAIRRTSRSVEPLPE
jgi:prevent-host-death family protein